MKPLWLFLPVNPEPWAVGPLQIARRGGKVTAYMGRNQQLATYQEAIREAVRDQWGALPTLQGYVSLDVYLWRNRAQYTTPNQRKHRKHEADATNMLKALEDALQGVLFDNDKDNISVSSHIMEQDEIVSGKAVIRLQVVSPAPHRQAMLDTFPEEILSKIVQSEESYIPSSDNTWTGKEGMF